MERKNLSGNIGAGSNAPKFYTYNGTDNTKAEVIADSFFDDVADILEVGSLITATTSTVPVALYVVSISAANVVVTGYVANA